MGDLKVFSSPFRVFEKTFEQVEQLFTSFFDLRPPCRLDMTHMPLIRSNPNKEGNKKSNSLNDAYYMCVDKKSFGLGDLSRVWRSVRTMPVVYKIACKPIEGDYFKSIAVRGNIAEELWQTYRWSKRRVVDGENVCAVLKRDVPIVKDPKLSSGSSEAKFALEVDWNQANALCAAQGKRLPTKTEWEALAGNEPISKPSEKSLPVREWVSDWGIPISSPRTRFAHKSDNSFGHHQVSSLDPVVNYGPMNVESAIYYGNYPTYNFVHAGFRCVSRPTTSPERRNTIQIAKKQD